jgi:hypothetical protein
MAEGDRQQAGRRTKKHKRGVDSCVWTKQVQHVFQWIQAFLDLHLGSIHRNYTLEAFRGAGDQVLITTDASPWGLGGTLEINGKILSYFANAVAQFDCDLFDAPIGDAMGQQTWEALALLVALRIWAKHWQESRVKLVIRGDSTSALHMLLNLKSKGRGSGMIARELALDFADGTYYPDIITHVPGVSLTIVDSLSRRFMPRSGAAWRLPLSLRGADEVIIPLRNNAYFKALFPPHVAGG